MSVTSFIFMHSPVTGYNCRSAYHGPQECQTFPLATDKLPNMYREVYNPHLWPEKRTMEEQFVQKNPNIQGGVPAFRGPRVL